MVECTIFGGILLDRYLEVEAYPERGQDGLILNEFSMAGGCSVNMAATFNNLGGTAHMVSCIGGDPTGREIMDYLGLHGFSGKHIKEAEGDTGYSLVILEKNGERTFLTKKGVESRFVQSLIPDVSCVKNVMVTGYYLLCDDPHGLLRSLREARKHCGYFLFDPGPLVDEIDPLLLKEVLSMADIITLNETEAAKIGLARAEDPSSPVPSVQTPAVLAGSRLIVIKKGKSGGSALWGKERFDYPAKETAAVDTTGAGDSFAAGLMFGILSGMDVRSAVSLAAESAAITVTIKGPHGFWEKEKVL